VPPGTVFEVHVAEGRSIEATARWSRDDRMGVEFESSLSLDATGRVDMTPPRSAIRPASEAPLRRAG
jgi:hypothetical protein